MIKVTQVLDAKTNVIVHINPEHIVMIRDGREGVDPYKSFLILNSPHLNQLQVAETRAEIKAAVAGRSWWQKLLQLLGLG